MRDFKPGFYVDISNSDLWRMDKFGKREVWTWVNGVDWKFVPKEHLVWAAVNDQIRNTAVNTQEVES